MRRGKEHDARRAMGEDIGFGDFPLPLSVGSSAMILLETDFFCAPAAGAGGNTPNHVLAFRTVLRQPDAAPRFRDLVRSGKLAGQLYALCGLFLLDRPAFEREVTRYRAVEEKVFTLFGVRVGSDPVSAIVAGNPAAGRPGIAPGGLPDALAGK